MARGPRGGTALSRGSPLVVGIDVGSTNTKAVVVGLDASVRAVARRPTPSRPDGDGGTVHPIEALLATVESVVRDAVALARRPTAASEVARGEVAAIGIASVAEAGAPVDADGRPLDDVLAWFDPRPRSLAVRLGAEVGPNELFARTGLRPEAKVTLAKLAWLRRERPSIMKRMTGWRFVADLVAGCLAEPRSSVTTSVTLACRSMAWDLRAAGWDAELLALVGMRADQMPAAAPWTQPAATVAASAGARLDVPAGVPVAVAGHDHVVGGLAAGVVESGDVLDSMGTAEALLMITRDPVLRPAVCDAGFSVGAHVLPDRSTLMAGLQTSGAFVDWFLGAFGGLPIETDGDERHAVLQALVASARGRPSGIVARPTLRGRTAPDPDAQATASFEGLSAGHGLGDLALAALEGTAFHVRWMEDELARISGEPIRRVRAIGGGTENEALLEVKAALSPAPLEIVDEPEAVAVGAALVAAVAAGLATPDEMFARRIAVRAAAASDAALASAYDEIYRARFRPAAVGAAAASR
ncbi:MAG TPA: FGGY family carbohydrate kinase [Candidatus Limnocylindrales bacterium]|nr:FGGY family carbohydrate kinase [Candidatus Limnocylindrales bacterium]